MVYGCIVLFSTDGLLSLAAVWLLRSRRFEDGPPLSVVLPATFAALIVHVLAYIACQALLLHLGEITGEDASTRMQLFLVNMASGSLPAILFGYALVVSFANTCSVQISMMGKKPEPVSTDAFRQARGLSAQGQYALALEECRKLKARFPDSPLAPIEIALIQTRMECPSEAADTLRAVLRKFPQDTDVRRRASLLLADLMEYSLNEPETAAYLRNGCYKDTEPVFGEPVPQWVEMNRARHLAKQGEVDQAVAAYREIFQCNSGEPRPLLEAATILEKAGRPTDAADVLRELARASIVGGETWAEAMYRLARLFDHHFDDPEALVHTLKEILRKAPGSKAAGPARQMLQRDAGRLTDI